MGFYIRKSINFGGVRFNLSKSGIGTSVGMKGFRIGSSPRGNYVHMGRNGIYYRAAIGKKKSSTHSTHNLQQVNNSPTEEMLFHDIESGDVSLITDSSSQEIINEITSKQKKIPLCLFAASFVLIPSVGILLAIVAGLLLYFFVDKKRKTTILFYDIEEQTENEIQQFYNSFDEILMCQQAWHISARAEVAARDRKYQSNASSIIKRTNVKIQYKTPSYIKTNVKVLMIPVGKQKMYLFPDRILIFKNNKVGGLSYANFNITQHDQRFIESGTVPKDGTIIDYTWKYVNKSGGPDKRFRNNQKLPILMYSQILCQSNTGLNELIQLSRQGAGVGLVQQLNRYKSNGFLG